MSPQRPDGKAQHSARNPQQYGARLPFEVLSRIHELVADYEAKGLRPNAARIAQKVHDEYPDGAPSEKTVQNIVASRRPDDSGAWQPTVSAPGIDPSLAMPVLALVVEASEGTRRHLTLAEARLVTAVRIAAPTITPAMALAVAREYISGTTSKDALDSFLSFSPWADAEGRGRYEIAVEAGWVQPSGVWLRQRRMESAVATINARRAASRDKAPVKGARVVNLGGDAKTARKSARKGSEA